jgi:hypothetical protein
MSTVRTDYDVFCVTCGMRLVLDQAREPQCAALIQAAPWIARLGIAVADRPAGMFVELTFAGWLKLDTPWFVAHGGHDLAVRSEYGNISGLVCASSRPVLEDGEDARVRAAVLVERGGCMTDMLAAAEAAAKGRP